MRFASLAALALAPLAVLAVSSPISLSNARFTITRDGEEGPVRAGPLSLARPITPALNLTNADTLRLTFTVFVKPDENSDEASNIVPHQTFLRFYHPSTGEEGIQPVRVKAGGKAKFDLVVAKPPVSIPPTPDETPLQVTLMLGSFKYTGAQYKLFELHLPRTQPAPQHAEAHLYRYKPLIAHTFREDPKLPPRIVSLVFAATVLAPWVVLIGLLSRIPLSLPNLLSHKILPFVVLLGAFEGLLFTYWLRLRLGDVLLYGALLAIPTAVTAKRALGALVQWRLGEKQ